ncbi:MAG: HIT family protein [Phycisphaerales bacterium]|nr:MAG: HIT family protein [Phycisphaerales bacterium]
MPETIFTKILSGTIPAHKVHEDHHTFAFLDINPLSPGHTLLIPKVPVAKLHELSDEAAAALGRVLPRLCRAIVHATGIPDYNILQNNGSPAHQAVFHVHIHIIPKPNATQGLNIHWPASPLDPALAKSLVTKITTALRE